MNNDMRGLEVVAAKGRLLGLDMVYHCASGHLGGSFSAMDILTVLYFDVMRVDPKDPKDPDRDRFVLSKGHCTPALYPILAQRGYFPEEDLKMFRSVEGHMSGHALIFSSNLRKNFLFDSNPLRRVIHSFHRLFHSRVETVYHFFSFGCVKGGKPGRCPGWRRRSNHSRRGSRPGTRNTPGCRSCCRCRRRG